MVVLSMLPLSVVVLPGLVKTSGAKTTFLKLFKSGYAYLHPKTPLAVGNFSTNFTPCVTSIIKFIDIIDDAREGTKEKFMLVSLD